MSNTTKPKSAETDTPRTDAKLLGQFDNPFLQYVNIEFARTLERELNEAAHNCKECLDLVQENVQLRSDLKMCAEALTEISESFTKKHLDAFSCHENAGTLVEECLSNPRIQQLLRGE